MTMSYPVKFVLRDGVVKDTVSVGISCRFPAQRIDCVQREYV